MIIKVPLIVYIFSEKNKIFSKFLFISDLMKTIDILGSRMILSRI